LFLKNPIAFWLLLLFVNGLFWVIGTRDLAFLPTVFFLLMVKSLIQLAIPLFPTLDTSQGGTYRIFTVAEVSAFLAEGGRLCRLLIRKVCPDDAPISAGGTSIGILFVLFVVFKYTETFWVNVVLVNLLIPLPAILFSPPIKRKILDAAERYGQ
jgi:hypothetical protein